MVSNCSRSRSTVTGVGGHLLLLLAALLIMGNSHVSYSWVMTPINNNNKYTNKICTRKNGIIVTNMREQQQQQQRFDCFQVSATKTADLLKPRKNKSKKSEIVPIILLSGFLGSGKTTVLKHLLENKEGKKLGVIVNDVASVNVDAKLVAQQRVLQDIDGSDDNDDDVISAISKNDDDIEMIELQNGCACCSIADDFISSVNQMLQLKQKSKRRNDKWDAIVVELSGVADPIATKSNWNNAKLKKLEGTDQADISRIITLVDACTFGTDWMSWDTAEERQWIDNTGDDCAAVRNVPELLAEQVEAADLLIVNKLDMSGREQANIASSVARGINEKAKILQVEHGKVSPQDILSLTSNKPKAKESKCCGSSKCSSNSNSNKHEISLSSHEHSHEHEKSNASHEHSHEHKKSQSSHEHSHDHDAATASSSSSSDCADPGCTDGGHSHSHSHEHTADCADADCTDTTHSHEHSHDSTATKNLGISNFVYKSSRPFHGKRLMNLLSSWPVPIKEKLDFDLLREAQDEGYEIENGQEAAGSPFIGVLRSKGFCWIGPSRWSGPGNDSWRHDTAMFWSHAGKHFSVSISGKWWATLSQAKMKRILGSNPKEYERIMKEDFVSEEFKDRRQELVFIGANINEEAITDALDECLVTEKEFNHYRQQSSEL